MIGTSVHYNDPWNPGDVVAGHMLRSSHKVYPRHRLLLGDWKHLWNMIQSARGDGRDGSSLKRVN